MKIWNPNDTTMCLKLEAKRQPQKDAKNLISNPKRYEEHPYHFTIKEPPPPPPPGQNIDFSFISHASTFLIYVFYQFLSQR